jgi:hypothetical protein
VSDDESDEECVCFCITLFTLCSICGWGRWGLVPAHSPLTHSLTHTLSHTHTHMTTPTAPPSISLEDYLQDPTHLLTHSAVSHWSYSPYSGGAWSQLSVGGTPLHRRDLGECVSERVVLAGEACHVKFPAMVSE